jgi:O-antigen/teichoic acid export membrane protein
MAVATRIYAQTDAVFLALLSREAVLGWYSAAYRIIGIPMFIPVLVTTPMLPALSRAAADMGAFRQTLRNSFITVLLLTLPPCALIMALAPSIPTLLHWPDAFHHSVPLMMILALHIPLVAVDMVLASGFFALHLERQWLKIAIAAAVVNPVLNFLLIPYFERTLHNGAVGAATVTVATEFLMFGGALLLLPSGTLTRETVLLGGRLVLAGILTAITAVLVATVSPLAALPAGCLVFAAAVFGLRVVRPGEIQSVMRMVLGPLARRRSEATL